MNPWRFLDYWPEEGSNPIREWYAVQDFEVRAEFDVAVAILAQTEDWLDPSMASSFRLLTRAETGIGEIVFYVDVPAKGKPKPLRRRFRVFGILRAEHHEFVLLIGSEKKRGLYVPPNAPRLAKKYQLDFEQGKGWTSEHI